MANASAAKAGAEPKKSKRPMILIGAAVALLGVGGGGAGWFFLSRKADAAAPAHPPKRNRVFLQLEPLTVNLRDEVNRFAQVGISLELFDNEAAEQIKAVMPAVRDRVLRLVSERSAATLLSSEGKTELGAKVMEAIAEQIKFEPPRAKPRKGSKKHVEEEHDSADELGSVHFTQFIIQ